MRSPVAAVALVMLALPAPASGQEVTRVSYTTVSGVYSVRANDSEERNAIVVSQDDAGNVLIDEFGVGHTLVAEQQCTLLTTTRASCPRDPNNIGRLRIFAGEGDDVVDLAPLPVDKASSIASREVFGGGGNDTLYGSGGVDRLEGDGRFTAAGGPIPAGALPLRGRDVLRGGGGADALLGGDGNDYLNGDGDQVPGDAGNSLNGGSGADFFDAGASAGPDVIVGGSGEDGLSRRDALSRPNPGGLANSTVVDIDGGDTVSYGTRSYTTAGSAGVVADLDGVADDGATGEGDTIGTDVESLAGTIRDDRLTGSNAANHLTGGLGLDRLIPNDGADRLNLRDGIADPCYTSTSLAVLVLDLVDPPVASCPRVLFLTLIMTPVDEKKPAIEFGPKLVRAGTSGLRIPLVCPPGPYTCAGRLAIATGRRARSLRSVGYRVRAGRRSSLVVRLSPAGLQALRRSGRATLTARFSGTSKKGVTTSTADRRMPR